MCTSSAIPRNRSNSVSPTFSRLALEQKAQVLNHRGTAVVVDGFSLRADQWNQCLNGVKWDRPTTLFPTCIALAATWNTNLVREVASVLSDEARAIYNGWHLDPNAPGEHKGLIYRAPVINIGRNPYWGRNHEAWGEDPFLTGRMTVSYVQGLQGDDPRYLKVAATLKHYAVNNVEKDRQKLNAIVSERMLREYWLPHFRDGVVEGHAQSVMASYNAINGTPNNMNRRLLTEVLKGEWHHDGFVVSDLGGVRTMVQGHGAGRMSFVDAVAQSVMAGCDFSDKEYEVNIPVAVREGKLTEERLNDAVTRVLRVRMRLGEFDPFGAVPYSRISPDTVGNGPHRAVALEAARQSIVLLKNRGGLLPLDPFELKRVAVIGPLADRVVLNNYNGQTGRTVTAFQGLKDRLPANCEVTHVVGGEIGGKPHNYLNTPLPTPIDRTDELRKAADAARTADVALVFVGTDHTIEHEGRDRTSLGLPGNQEELVKAVFAANPRTVVVQMSAGPLSVSWLATHIPALLQAWWPGEEGGHAIADVLLGAVSPAGRLPHTVYAVESQVPPQDEYDISRGFTYMYVNGAPLFPFGHGLSYTRFRYSNLRLSTNSLSAQDKLTVSVDIQNTGRRSGDEVAQLYVHQVNSRVKQPAKELRGFQRIILAPKTRQTVRFELLAEKLARWDDDQHAFVVEPGAYELMVGASSADLRATATVNVLPKPR